jgi:hypothetical protein
MTATATHSSATSPFTPGSPIIHARTNPLTHAAAAPNTVGHSSATSLSVDSRVAAATHGFNAHSGHDDFHHDFWHHDGHSHDGHHDHHDHDTFFISAGIWWPFGWWYGYPWYSYPYYPYYPYYYGYPYGDGYPYGYPVGYGTGYPLCPTDGSTIINYSNQEDTPAMASEQSDNDYRAYSSQVQSPAPSTAESVTVYRSNRDNGAMAWSDTAASIVNTMVYSTDRAKTAQQYLGRTPTGAWEVMFQSSNEYKGGTELVGTGITPTGSGQQPTIIVHMTGNASGFTAGERLSVTGRLTEVSVDDPDYPGGMLLLENGNVSR